MDSKKLRKAVEVGAFRLESAPGLKINTSQELHAQICRIIGLIPEYGINTNGVLSDLIDSEAETARYTLFTVKSHTTRAYEKIYRHNEVDIRFTQGVRVEGVPLWIKSIFHTTDFNPLERAELVGGRRVGNWSSQGIPGLQKAPVLSPDAPSYDSISDLAVDLELLCPTSDTGFTARLACSFAVFAAQES